MEYFSKDRPFLNFNEMIGQYDTFLISCDCNIKIERVEEHANRLNELKIFDICHRAEQEIQNQVFVPNNNVQALIQMVKTKLTKIENKIDKLIEDNQLSHVDKMPRYYNFFDTLSPFWQFYDWFFIEVYPLYTNDSEAESKPKRINAPVIALFCSSLNDSKVLKKGYEESIKDYCKRVCFKYELPYGDRVRQFFNDTGTKKNKQKVKELILPLINAETAALITKHLENLK
jgi:transcription termination factor NusB